MKCDNCPYKLNGDCQVWYMNGVSFSCNGIHSQVFIETNVNVSADTIRADIEGGEND